MATAFESEDSSIVEFQLGNKQLFLLFLGLLVICAIFFFIGLRVGEDTAKAKIPVQINGETQPATRGATTEQTLDLQPLSGQQQKKVTETPSGGSKAADSATKETVQKPAATETETAKNTAQAESKPESKPAAKKKEPANTTAVATKGIFVQVLASPDKNKALAAQRSIRGDVGSQIQTANVKGTVYHRVLIGPFKSRDAAGEYRQKIKSQFKGAFLQIIR